MPRYALIRVGWNGANQSAMGRPAKPKTDYESGRWQVVAVFEAASLKEANARRFEEAEKAGATVYNNQHLFTRNLYHVPLEAAASGTLAEEGEE